MALKDCMRKVGKALNRSDKAKLHQFLEDGMSDEEAVKALQAEINTEIVDVATVAKKEGVEVATKPSQLAEIKSFREAQLKSLRDKLRKSRQQSDALAQQSDEKSRAKLREVLVEEAGLLDQIEELTGKRGKGSRYFQGKRGAITFDEMRKGVIKLTEAADKSTFIHEAGHLYLEIFRSLAEEVTAPEQIQQDWQRIMKFLDIKSGDEITTKHHEKFARGFERYAMAGKAPSIEMQDAFNEFRVWLLSIYRKMRAMLVPLDKSITGVFDRMLASDEAIAEAETVQQYAATFVDAEMANMTLEAFAAYRRSHMRAHNEEVDKLTAQTLADLERIESEEWQHQLQIIRDKVAEEVYQMPVYRALAMLQYGTNPDGSETAIAPFKLDKASIVDAARGDSQILKKLPGGTGKYGVYRLENGVDIDVAAQMYGFGSGLELLDALLKTPKMDAYIEAEANARMRQQFPDPMLDGTMIDRAIQTAHTERRAEVIAFELRHLRKLARQDKAAVAATKKTIARETKEAREANKAMLPKRAELAAIKIAARIAVGKKQIRNIKPHVYLRAEQKAGRLAFEAASKGDFEKAYQHKLEQILNFERYRAAVAAKKQTDNARKYLAKFEKAGVRKRLGRSDILDEIDAVLEGVDLKRRSLTEVDRLRIEDQLSLAVKEHRLVLPPGVLNRIFNEDTNWQDLTVEEFGDMRDLVKQLEKQAKSEVEAIVNGEKVLLDDAANDVTESIREHGTLVLEGVGAPKRSTAVPKGWKRGVSSWLRTSAIARILDRSEWGAVTRRIIVPIRRAYAERLVPWTHKAQKDVAAIYRAHYNNDELGELNRKNILIEAQNETYSKADILALALNWGNDGNRTAVMAGVKRNGERAYTDLGVKQMLAQMTEADWQFVQDIWDYYETYWPQIAEASRRRRGIVPKRVEAEAFSMRTADGKDVTLSGGYHPLKYDHRHSDRQQKLTVDKILDNIQNSFYITTSTRAGATYERTQQRGAVVRLDLNIIESHLREIIRDIAIGDEAIYLTKLLNRKDISDAFNETGNEAHLETFKLWLTDSAVGELPAEGPVEQITSWVRTGFTKSKLAWNATVTFLQFTGMAQTAAVIGTTHYMRGLGLFMADPAGQWQEVMEKSKFLHTRYVVGTWDKDVQDTRSHLESVFGPAPTRLKTGMTMAAKTYFWPIMKAQQGVDVTTWLAAHHKGVTVENLSDEEAILYADAAVEKAQTSGFFSDRSGLERGTLGFKKNRQAQFIRIWTTLISYMLAKGNIAYEKTSKTSFKDPAQVLSWAGDMMLLFVVEGILSGLLYGRRPDDEDDDLWDMETLSWIGAQTLESVASGVPFVREIGGARFSSGTTPVGGLATDLWKLGEQIGQGELDEGLAKAFIRASGTVGHFPSTQTNRALEYLWAEDDEVELYHILSGPPREDR